MKKAPFSFKYLLILAFLLPHCLPGCTIIDPNRCKRLNTLPIAPVYTESELVDFASRAIGRSRPMVTYYYESGSSPDKIIAFYEERGACGLGEDLKSRELCKGNATPSGEYFVYIDLDSYMTKGITTYAVEIIWHGCSDRLE
jgi:hypothetical protein